MSAGLRRRPEAAPSGEARGEGNGMRSAEESGAQLACLVSSLFEGEFLEQGGLSIQTVNGAPSKARHEIRGYFAIPGRV